jgi:rhodanese-related sulfurtransferase
MTDSTASFDALAFALADIRARFGKSGFADRRRLISLLADKVPEAKREIRAVGTAVDEGVPVALAGCERHLLGMEIDRLAERLESATGLRIDIARPVVRAFAYAMDLGPLPSVYVASTPAINSPAQVGAAGWAGLSEPVAASTNAGSAPWPVQQPPVPPTAPAVESFVIAGRAFPKVQVIGAGVLLAVLAAGSQLVGSGGTTPVVDNGTSVTVSNFADEGADYGVPAQRTLQSNVGTPTPLDIPVGKRIATSEVQSLMASDASTLLVDVLDNQHATTIKSAKFLPMAGAVGSLTDGIQPRVTEALKALVADKPARPLVFFCAGSKCWESYNAVLRADAAQFRTLYWYRGGLASWQAAGLPMEPTPAPVTATP